MKPRQDGKTVYAQSSDIKSRTFLEYRKDMKRKAIIELELLEWLNNKVRQEYGKTARISKAGGDAFLWFLRQGGITREPDYLVENVASVNAVEMQYGSGRLTEQSMIDFKKSKIASKRKGIRIPKEGLLICYLFSEAPKQYAFLTPKWIYANSREGVAPAWGNAPTYKLPGDRMLDKIKQDNQLPRIWQNIKYK